MPPKELCKRLRLFNSPAKMPSEGLHTFIVPLAASLQCCNEEESDVNSKTLLIPPYKSRYLCVVANADGL